MDFVDLVDVVDFVDIHRSSPSPQRPQRPRRPRPLPTADRRLVPPLANIVLRPRSAMPQNVLVVEDDDSVRQLLIEYLKEHSITHVDSARDGADALHHVYRQSYDVIILDVMMPHMTGIDFLDSLQVLSADRTIKTLRQRPAVIIITSASAEQIPNDQLEERSPGIIRAVLRKPLEMNQLQSWLDRLLR